MHRFPVSRTVPPFLCGIAMSYCIGGTLYFWVWAAMFAASLSFFIICSLFSARLRNCISACKGLATVGGACLYIMVFSAGWMLMLAEKIKMNTSPVEGTVPFEAIALSTPERHGRTWQFDALVVSAGQTAPKPFRSRLSILSADSLCRPLDIGDGIAGNASFNRPQSFPGSRFNYPRYLYSRGIRAQALLRDGCWTTATIATHKVPPSVRLTICLRRYRSRLIERYSALGISGDNLAVAAALTLGDKSMLSRNVRDYYSASGASHILALSGLHLSIIYMLLSSVLCRRKNSLAAELFVLATVWAYVMLAGLPVSAVRSAIMLSLCSIAALTGRGRLSVNRLAVAAAVVVVGSPIAITDVGFQMSFICVLSILLVYRPLFGLLPMRWLRLAPVRWTWGMLCMSASAQIAVAPLTVLYFQRFPCYFFLTNFIAVPGAMLLLYGAAVLLLTGFIPAVQELTAHCMNIVASLLNGLLQQVAGLPGASIGGLSISATTVVLVYALMATLYLLCRMLWLRRPVATFTAPYPDC